MALDGLYKEAGDHEARVRLLAALQGEKLEPAVLARLTAARRQVHVEWAGELAKAGKHKQAAAQMKKAVALVDDRDWRAKYKLVSELSRMQLQAGDYTGLVLHNEEMLPRIEDPALVAQVRRFLGQVYLEWGGRAEQARNAKSALLRYRRALDYLPEEDWRGRLAASRGLAAALQLKGDHKGAADTLEASMPLAREPEAARQHALYLGKIYAGKAGNPKAAARWLGKADNGGNDDLSVEAAYLLAEQELEARRTGAALKRLRALTRRDLKASRWIVPVHYRLAVLLHQQKKLRAARTHYRKVAGVKNRELRKLYGKIIKQSRQKAREISAFLKSRG